MKDVTFKEWFVGTVSTLLLGFMGWTALNTHLLLVQMAKAEVGNAKDHTAIVVSICSNTENINTNSIGLTESIKNITNNSSRLTRLEAIKEEEDDEAYRHHTN